MADDKDKMAEYKTRVPKDNNQMADDSRLNTDHDSGDGEASSNADFDSQDGGWGWVVCFSSFVILFVLDGTMFSFGVLLLELLAYFDAGMAKTAAVGSTLMGMSMFMGPFVSVLLENFSCRQVTIAGSLISATAFIISMFSPNIEVLILTYGVIAGIGFCMCYLTSIITVGLYFKQKRAIATGLATSGSGLGTFIYAYLTNYLLSIYDWRGTILILSAITLNVVACGVVFRPLQSRKSRTNSSNVSHVTTEHTSEEEIIELIPQEPKKTQIDLFKGTNMISRLACSTDAMHVTNDTNTGVPRGYLSYNDVSDCKLTKRHSGHHSKRAINFYSGSLARLPHYESVSMAEDLSTEEVKVRKPSPWSQALATITGYLELFKNPVFVRLLLMNIFWSGVTVPLTYIPDLGVSKQLDTMEAATLLSIVGIANIIGRVLSGAITDMFRIRSTLTYTVSLVVASGVCFLFPWGESFVSLAVASAVFGLCMATQVSLRTIVLADQLGIDQLSRSFGMVTLFQGATYTLNGPLAGYLHDVTGSYVMPFSYAGAMYLVSACLCCFIHCTPRYLHDVTGSYVMPFSYAGAMYLVSACLCCFIHCTPSKHRDNDSIYIDIHV